MQMLDAGFNTISNARYPRGPNMPNYITKAKGCYVWDDKNRKYIDWTASLGTIIRGYEEVRGFPSLPMKTRSEEILTDLLCDIYPADIARFFKNGSDATDAAIRLSRYITGRNDIASCGYHGWHDCFINTYGRHNSGYSKAYRGVPLRDCQIGEIDWNFHYWRNDDLETVINSRPACVIIEPLDRRNPEACTYKNLHKVQKLCKDNDILFIVDEILSGFRFAKGGITELFGLEPDLICLGKAMSNGSPLSALIGKKEIMSKIKDIFVTGTYFTDSMAFEHAIYNINKLNKDDFVALRTWGLYLRIKLQNIISDKGLDDFVSTKGFGPWLALEWKDKTAEHYFIQEIIKQGVLTNRDYFVTFSHEKKNIDRTIKAHEKVFSLISKNRNQLDELLINTEIGG